MPADTENLALSARIPDASSKAWCAGLFARGAAAAVRSPVAVIGFLTLVLAGMVWGGLLAQIESDRAQAIDNVRRDNANLARAFAEHTLRTLDGVDQALLSSKRRHERSGARIDTADGARDVLSTAVSRELGIIDEHGIYLMPNSGGSRRVDVSDREYFKAHQARDSGELHVSRPVPDPQSGKWTLQLTRRINKPDGSFGGVVIAALDPGHFSRVYGEIDLGSQGLVALVGTDGIVRARHAGADGAVGQSVVGSLFHEHLKLGDAGFLLAPGLTDKTARFLSYRKLTEYPLVVAVGRGEDDVMAQAGQRQGRYLAWGGALTIAILIFALSAGFLLTSLQSRRRRADHGSRGKAESPRDASREMSAA